jgi:hypothetical protein
LEWSSSKNPGEIILRVLRKIGTYMKRKSTERTKGNRRRSNPAAPDKYVQPQTIDEYFALTAGQQDLWRRSAHVVTQMRTENASLQRASREGGVDPAVVLQLAGSALRKSDSGRYEAKSSDRLLRVLAIPNLEGVGEIATRDSRQASQLATYWDAVQKYLQTGDATVLSNFEGVYITDARGAQVPLLTDLDELDRLASAGVLSFESLYVGVA